MSPIPPYSDEATDSLTYDLSLVKLGASSNYRIENEILGNYAKVDTGERPEPFKLLERDPHHAVVFDMQERSLQAPDDSVPEEEPLLAIAAGPFTKNRLINRRVSKGACGLDGLSELSDAS